MKKIVHYIGLDVHKDSIAVSIAPQNFLSRQRKPKSQRDERN